MLTSGSLGFVLKACDFQEMFVTLVKDLKSAFESKGYILTSAVAVTQSHIDLSYDVPALTE